MAKNVNNLQYKVLIEQDEQGWYVASVPELPSCYTQGKTLEQVRTRIREAIELALEENPDLKKDKLSSPRPNQSFFGIEEITIKYA